MEAALARFEADTLRSLQTLIFPPPTHFDFALRVRRRMDIIKRFRLTSDEARGRVNIENDNGCSRRVVASVRAVPPFSRERARSAQNSTCEK